MSRTDAVIKTGETAHRLLSVACAEPLTFRQLQDRADRRYGPHQWNWGVGTMACIRLAALGLLEITERGHGQTPSRYTLHPLGEHLLDEMDVLHRTVEP